MKRRIFLVEDDQSIRDIVTIILEDIDFEVKSFKDATSFKAEMQKSQPDIYLLDINLPDGNGIELAKMIKNTLYLNHLPVILMSARKLEEIDCIDCYDDFIPKPFDIFDLQEKIKSYTQIDS